jgi:hypothetical protein
VISFLELVIVGPRRYCLCDSGLQHRARARNARDIIPFVLGLDVLPLRPYQTAMAGL